MSFTNSEREREGGRLAERERDGERECSSPLLYIPVEFTSANVLKGVSIVAPPPWEPVKLRTVAFFPSVLYLR